MKHVLFVSKPVAPPWSDSSKNLVRDLAEGIDRFHLHLIEHGRLICHARRPECGDCVLNSLCPGAFSV